MVKSVSILTQCPGDSSLTTPVLPSNLGSGEEHVAQLADLTGFGLLLRSANLLDEGVAAIFGLAGVKAELVALCFCAGQFTPARAATWLAEWDFKPMLFVTQAKTEVSKK